MAGSGNAYVEDIDYRASRGLDRSMMRSLANDSAWVSHHENVFLIGPTGVGKSWLACALAQKACRDGYLVLYTRAAALFRDLAVARADGSMPNLLARLSRVDVLVIDDWAWRGNRAPRLLGICEERYQRRSEPRSLPGLREPASPSYNDPFIPSAVPEITQLEAQRIVLATGSKP